jgi:hypothetical protein
MSIWLQILGLCLDQYPVGLSRALGNLPPKVLTADSYRKLVDLLIDPTTAKFLHHSKSITDLVITGLHNLPAALRRPAIISMCGKVDGMHKFVDGLRFLASRASLPFVQVATEIGCLDQPEQIAAKLRQLTERLPLPSQSLPLKIGNFRRLDTIAEIRGLAKNWRNCLAECLYTINDGTAAVFQSEDWQAVCYISRQGRMGWFVAQVRGPKNVAIEPNQLAQIYAAFAAASISDVSIIEAIKNILITHEWSRRRQPDDDVEIIDAMMLD